MEHDHVRGARAPWAARVLHDVPIGLVVADRTRVLFANARARELTAGDPRSVLDDIAWQDSVGRARVSEVVRLSDGSVGRVGLLGVRLGRRPRAPWVFAVLDGTEHPMLDTGVTALSDPLTGLPGRLLLLDEVKALRDRGPDAARGAALAFVDLDGFKALNVGSGHRVGDEVLRQVALRLRRALPERVLVSRLGGDEFGILFPADDPQQAAARLERLAEAQGAEPVRAEGSQYQVQFSAGITALDAETVDQVLAQADRALYHAKANTRGKCAVFGVGSGFLRTRRQLHEHIDELAAAKDHLEQVTLTDHLTGLPNVRALDQALDELDRAHLEGQAYSLLFVDLDRFGSYNHTYGDAAGDVALQRVAAALRDNCRPGETAFRKGGEELVVVLPGCTVEAAVGVGERLRRAVEDLAIPHGGHPDTPVVTITVAVATVTAGLTAHELIDHASRGAFATKEKRQRNRVVLGIGPGLTG